MRVLCLNRTCTCNPTANACNVVKHAMLDMSRIHACDQTQIVTAVPLVVSSCIRRCGVILMELINGMLVSQAPLSKMIHGHSIARSLGLDATYCLEHCRDSRYRAVNKSKHRTKTSSSIHIMHLETSLPWPLEAPVSTRQLPCPLMSTY
jgi:phage FluMu gp28-like protein